MFFPKFVYEKLPYLYFLICGCLLQYHDIAVVCFSICLLYCAGCITLVARSAHRRLDRFKGNSSKQALPFLVYEYLPYAYIAIAMILVLLATAPILQFIAFCLMIFALRNLLFRVNNRRKAKSLF